MSAVRNARKHESGIVLLTSLLLLLLITGMAAGLVFLVVSQKNVSGADSQANLAYFAAEAGIERMTADLANLYLVEQMPSDERIASFGGIANAPTIEGVRWREYQIVPDDVPPYNATISEGAQKGLNAQIIPITLRATAELADGSQARMFRRVEVALVPVFQFGVFCDMDCAYHAGSDFDFAGRVHSNGNLFLSAQSGYTATFHDKITVATNPALQRIPVPPNTYENAVVRKVMPNGETSGSGTVYIPKRAAGCDTTAPNANCRAIGINEGSVTSGIWPPVLNTNWGNIVTTYAGYIQTGVPPLELPFIPRGALLNARTPLPIEIIRRPQTGDSAELTQSRLYNAAAIRIILEDDPRNLCTGCTNTDPDNVSLQGMFDATECADTDPVANPFFRRGYINLGTCNVPSTYYFMPIATATNGNVVGASSRDSTWVVPRTPAGQADPYNVYPGQIASFNKTSIKTTGNVSGSTDWPLLSGFLRIEIRKADGGVVPVTREWLKLGFTRRARTPDTEPGSTHAGQNPEYPNSIILLQQWANRNNDAASSCWSETYTSGTAATPRGPVKPAVPGGALAGCDGTNTTYPKFAPYAFYPLNLYDTREGEARDVINYNSTECSVNGVMNTVDLDVGNLRRWLMGQIAGAPSGTLVDELRDNGYILYFSDRRGNEKLGEENYRDGGYDYLDTINLGSSTGTPNGRLETDSHGVRGENIYVTTAIPDGNFGRFRNPISDTSSQLLSPPAYIAAGFPNGSASTDAININSGSKVFTRKACTGVAGAPVSNLVMGPRHALRLVNGSLGKLPTRDTTVVAGKEIYAGGFTVASEQPVYLMGNYNAKDSTGAWDDDDAAAAIIADAVTLLSKNWRDYTSFRFPANVQTTDTQSRIAEPSFYRVAVAAGKSRAFAGEDGDFGADGGIHNFLRYIENWAGKTVWYKGSLVNLYYSAYATGIFKCCGKVVYGVPSDRNYSFDTKFLDPDNMPPGTPRFIQVVNTAFRQDLTPKNLEAPLP